jgi:hypothetical protein
MAWILRSNPLRRAVGTQRGYKITNQVRMFESNVESIRKRLEKLNNRR